MEESNPFGVDQNLRTSTLKWQRSTRGESHFDLENPKVLFHHFTSHFWTPVKLQMTFGPCQEASYTAVTLNPESNITRRERERNHSLFHWNTLTYPELLVQIWVPSKRSASMIIGISMRFETCQILGHVSHILLHWKKNVQTEICGLGRDWRENSWYPGQIIYGQISGRKRERIPSWRRGESEHMRNLNSTLHENCEEFSSFFPLTRNLRRPSRMHATNWKHQWLPLCLARSARIIRIVEMVSNPKRSIVNLHVFWKPVNRQDCVWKNHYRIIMKTI